MGIVLEHTTMCLVWWQILSYFLTMHKSIRVYIAVGRLLSATKSRNIGLPDSFKEKSVQLDIVPVYPVSDVYADSLLIQTLFLQITSVLIKK